MARHFPFSLFPLLDFDFQLGNEEMNYVLPNTNTFYHKLMNSQIKSMYDLLISLPKDEHPLHPHNRSSFRFPSSIFELLLLFFDCLNHLILFSVKKIVVKTFFLKIFVSSQIVSLFKETFHFESGIIRRCSVG
eukprot:GDKJ01019505.1.p1 GENE.GDKJ01019505.1~~GDKJ01019505.1.p1  ORF type:complete len:133 (-),score=6.05 GDKJ01019505.1:566-964(-)